MDNIEKVKKILKGWLPKYAEGLRLLDESPVGDWSHLDKLDDEFAQQICQLIKLPEGEPPLLSREDINGNPELLPAYIKYLKKYSYTKANRAIQRDSDIKWMRGE